jgi:sugar O-acyltransferase (sialic acid O-acetyltransferase NeuD family)
MEKLIIVGASGFGRELLQWIKDVNRKERKWEIIGFIDDNLHALDSFTCDYSVVGTIQDWNPSQDEVFALAIANPKTKEKIVKVLLSKGAKFTTVIHPTADIAEFCEYGEGFVAYPTSCLGPNCIVGNYVTLLSSKIGHDAVINDYVTISSFCCVNGNTHIHERAFLASNCVIPPSRKVGADAYVGAGSVIVRNVPNGKTVFGNPAKVIDV